MTFWQFLNENFLWIFCFVAFFGGSLTTWISKMFYRGLESREKQAKERTRQMELQLEIIRHQAPQRNALPGQVQPRQQYENPAYFTSYDQGYQAIEIEQREQGV